MGDVDGFEELVFQKVLGQLVALAGESSLEIPRQQRVLMARARNIAFDAQRKLLPHRQRFRVVVLYWNEALKLKLSTADPTSPLPDKPLWQWLEDWKLEDLELGTRKDGAKWNFLEFLGWPGESGINFSEAKHDDRVCEVKGIEDAYTAMQILEIPYRAALDLWLEAAAYVLEPPESRPGSGCEQATNDDSNGFNSKYAKRRVRLNKLFSWVANQTLLALNEQNYMSHDDRERCEESIRGTQYTSMKLVTGVLSMKPDYDTKATWSGSQPLSSLVVQTNRRWRLGPHPVSDARSDEVGSWNFMPPRPLAWFVLLHDLLVLTRGENLLGAPLTPAWNDHEWAGILWSPPHGDPWNNERTIFVPWPIPHWPSFWQLDGFLCAWNHIVRLAADKRIPSEGERLVTSLAYWWIRLPTSIFLLESKDFRLEGEDGHAMRSLARKDLLGTVDFLKGKKRRKGENRNSYSALPAKLKEVYELIKDTPDSEVPEAIAGAKRWLAHVGLMMTPEYGVSGEIVKHFSPLLQRKVNRKDKGNGRQEKSEMAIDELWRKPEVLNLIRETRARVLERFLNADLDPKPEWEEIIHWDGDELVFKDHREKSDVDWKSLKWNPLRDEVIQARRYRREAQKDSARRDSDSGTKPQSGNDVT